MAVVLPSMGSAQSGELVRQGQWSVEAPQGGCGSLLTLQAKGPGTLFESGNATALAGLQGAIASALATVCPGVTEAILVNGRTRRLVRLNQVAQEGGTPPTVASAPAQTTPSQRVSLSRSAASAGGQVSPGATGPGAAVPSTGQTVASASSAEAPPTFPERRSLASLSSAHSTREKCDVLFAWLETGKTASAPNARVNAFRSNQTMDIFQDSAMVPVFGKTYDALGNSVRIDLYEKTFGACTGTARRTPPQRTPFNSGRPIVVGGIQIRVPGVQSQQEAQLPPEYRQQFAQYSQLLQQAFGSSPGRYEPSAITAYVQQVREASRWANETVHAAADAPPTLQSFRNLQQAEGEVGSKAAQLTPADRDRARQYLHHREIAIAPAIAKNWLAANSNAAADLGTAKTLVTSHADLGAVIAALPQDEREHTESTYSAMLDHAVAPSLETATAPLAALPANWNGAESFAKDETAFFAEYGLFDGTPSYTAAMSRIDAARSRIFAAVLPEWRKKVATAHSPDGELLALREELRTLFVTPADRQLPLYQQFDEPIRQRQDQFDAAVKADEQRRLAAAERAAAEDAARASGELPASETADPAAAHTANGSAKTPFKAAAGTRSSPSNSASAGKPEPAVSRAALRPGELKAGSGPDAEILNAIYEGAFDKITFDRSSLQFAAIGNGYIEGFSSSCPRALLSSPVEIMETVCDGPYVITNQYGMVVRDGCSSSHQQGTGIFAEAKLYAALNSNPIQQVGSTMRTFMDVLTSGANPLTAGVGIALNVAQIKADASQMVSQTGCTNPALKQFQKNLQRFALSQGGLRLNGTVEMGVALLPPAPGTKYRDSDYGSLLDDMVSQQSGTWAMNRYLPGTITLPQVDKRDALGRPASISAGYAYSSLFTPHQTGTVTLSFEDGRPHCLFFSDQPNVCRTPSNRLTSAYIRGDYRK